MKKLALGLLIVVAAGCGSDGTASLRSGGEARLMTEVTPAHEMGGALPAYWLDRTHQKVTMDYVFGDNVAAEMVDLFRGLDSDSSMVTFRYRYNFGRGVREVYSDYEPVPGLWFGAGFGDLGFDFIIHFVYDMTQFNTGFALDLGDNATLEIEGTYLSVKDWPAVLENYLDARGTFTFFPTDDMFIGVGYKLDWYENSSGEADFSNIFVELGYLAGKAETGVELLFHYRQKGENGTDNQSDFVGGGLKWHMGKAVAVGATYENISGDFDEGDGVNLGLWISPGAGVHIKVGACVRGVDSTSEEHTNLNFGVSYAF